MEYLSRLKSASAALKDPNEWLFSRGYHTLWHGKLNRKTLDALRPSAPSWFGNDGLAVEVELVAGSQRPGQPQRLA